MRKNLITLLAALALGCSANSAQEVTYVEDCSQGLLQNKNTDNWFITLEGGSNIQFNKGDIQAKLKNRFGGNGAVYVGKWVNPNFGFRFGANYLLTKGATDEYGMFRKMNAAPIKSGYYPEKMEAVGPEFDVLINLTNWWAGYRPGRIYNAVLHGGGGAYWTFARRYKEIDGKDELRWRSARTVPLFINVGLQNNFRVSEAVDLFVDVQYNLININDYTQDLALSAGLNIHFGRAEWQCPVVAECPTWKYTDAEGDALVAELTAAKSKIADLQNQLDACLNRPQKIVECTGLCTIYYPINQYSLSSREKTILKSIASVMIENPSQKYVLTGWADNYTGNDEINTRLRNQRVDGVKNFLLKCGVPESQIDARIDAANLTDLGVNGAPLDRAVTIKLAD